LNKSYLTNRSSTTWEKIKNYIHQFYKVYAEDQIGETVFSQSEMLPTCSSDRKFYLSWSYYLILMRIKNVDERHFQEIEAVKNDWSKFEKEHFKQQMS
jgi:hypothetical protein